jgi:hypothetical protein
MTGIRIGNEMPSMRTNNICTGDSGGQAAQGVCEPAQVRYPRKRRENWPFKFYQENGKIYQNTVPKNLVAKRMDEIEEAPF